MAKFLVGFMGSGKSSLARLLDPDFVDMDALLTKKLGMSITAFFEQEGEPAFRHLETELLEELLTSQSWIATGGGLVTSPHNRKLLKSADQVIYLKADFETLYARIEADRDNSRPLFLTKIKTELETLFDQRQAFYEEVASQVVSVSGKSLEEIIEDIR